MVYFLASLPESFNVLVIALEVQSGNVPKWELATERLLHEETKLHKKVKSESKALAASGVWQTKPFHKTIKCHFCHKLGHMKKDCRNFKIQNSKFKNSKVKIIINC